MCKAIELRGKGFALAACAAILALAAIWTCLHLSVQPQGKALRLSVSQAAARGRERMAAQMPQGNIAINTATVDELCELKGIGTSLAEAIIAEREANGRFSFPEDLLSVKGIGQAKLEGFLSQITLE